MNEGGKWEKKRRELLERVEIKKRVAKKFEESRKSGDSREHLREYGKKGGGGGGKKINESRYNCNYNSN